MTYTLRLSEYRAMVQRNKEYVTVGRKLSAQAAQTPLADAKQRIGIGQRPSPQKRRKGPSSKPQGHSLLLAQIKANALPAPVREHRFHATRKWRFDYAWPDRLVALEVEGAVYSRGRHTRGAGYEADLEKYNAAAILGWRVLRYSTGQLKGRQWLADLMQLLY